MPANPPSPAPVLEALSDAEMYLYCILQDHSGLDQAEFTWVEESNPDACWRAYPFQWKWWRCDHPQQIDQCARAVGKSLSIKARMFAFPFHRPGAEAVITAPELVHLEPIVGLIERQFDDCRLGREMLPRGRSAITHRPFQMNFVNGARIIGRIPQRDGKGVKGLHPEQLEMDEAQDYPKPGWTELTATLNRDREGAEWRAHGVTRGIPDDFFKATQEKPGSRWRVHRITAMSRPGWNDEERADNIAQYGGSRNDPDYRRNVLGVHGDATNPIFVLPRLMRCWLGSTLVETSEGKLRIDEIQYGDRIRNALGWGDVTKVISSRHERIVEFWAGCEQFVCSPEHRVFTQRGWVEAEQLVAGDDILTADEAVRGMWGTHPEQTEQALLWQSLHREVAWSDLPRLGYWEADLADLRMVRDGLLSGVEAGAVLQRDLCRSVAWCASPTASSPRVRLVQGHVRTSACHVALLHDVLSRAVGELETSEGGAASWSPQQSRSGGIAVGTVRTLAGSRRIRGGLVSTVLGEPAGGLGGRHDLVHDRRRESLLDARAGGGWTQPSVLCRARSASGQVARRARVDRVEVLQRGDLGFARLSGGTDWVTLYDLTVSGHPSFSVGEQGLLSHNCVDDNESSTFNLDEYVHLEIKTEELEDSGDDIVDRLVFPASHTEKYKVFWIGQDVGYTHDPTEILVFAEYMPSPAERREARNTDKACPAEGLSRLKLLARITLWRVSNPLQVRAVLAIVNHYRPKAFSLDKTGVGLNLFQDLQAMFEAGDTEEYSAATIMETAKRIKGYNFSEKVIVDIDETIDLDEFKGDPLKDAAIEKNVLEYSTDVLRNYVDHERLWMPYDAQLIQEFNGQTFSYSKAGIDTYGRRRRLFSQGRFHALDAARMAAMGHAQESIEQLVATAKDTEPVLDVFVMA